MRARAMFGGVTLALVLAVAGPASAKVPISIVEANISGPGLGGTGGGIRIDAPAADRMWESGIVNDAKWPSLSEFRITQSDLGPRYLVTFRVLFASGPEHHLLRQKLYPYAKGGSVTHTPPGQELRSDLARIPIIAGWYEASPEFLEFLVEQGLPPTNPLAPAANPAPPTEPAADSASGQPAAWGWLIIGTVGLAALPLLLRRSVGGSFSGWTTDQGRASKGTMVRKSVRAILGAGIVAVALVAASAPAAAKCGHGGIPCPDPVRVRITLDGPGLAAPLVIRGKDAWTMLNVTGVTSRPYNVLNPVPAELGPLFQAVYRFKQGDREVLVYQDLYPYAAGRPFTFTPPGQRFVSRYEEIDPSGNLSFPVAEAGHGWRGSRTLETILREHGLPEDAPVSTNPSTGLAGSSPGGDTGPPWWVAGIVALGALVVVPRFRRRSS